MPTSTNLASYADVRAAFDQALSAERGVLVRTKDKGAAVHLMQRFNSFRRMDRDASRRIFEKEDKRHGSSVYDILVVRSGGDEESGWVRIERVPELTVEEL